MTQRRSTLPPEVVETYNFCISPKNRYVDEFISPRKFRTSNVGILSFHAAGLTGSKVTTEIEDFSFLLRNYLLALGYRGKKGASKRIRDAVTNPNAAMSDFLDVIDKAFGMKT